MEREKCKKNIINFTVYVAGISKQISKEELYKYFNQFGLISEITTFRKALAPSNTYEEESTQKGYCFVNTFCRQTFSHILNYQYHSIFGRSIYCTKYEEGSKLMRQNRMNNQRRVIIKQVPIYLELSSLRLLLEQTVGKVEILYQFKDSSTKPQCITSNNSQKFKSFSVMFEEKSCALFLLNLKELVLND